MPNSNATIKYFGFGTNKDLAMMQHMVGRDDLVGEPGQLIGYEVCTLLGKNFRDEPVPNSPLPITPRELIVQSWGPEFLMYVSRPNPEGVAYGTIWDLTPEDFELVREWEIVDYGAQEDAKGIAINVKGEVISVITQSFMKPPIPKIEHVITGADYEPYIHDKAAMLAKADKLRLQYLELKKKGAK